jgi:hypothetical protein
MDARGLSSAGLYALTLVSLVACAGCGDPDVPPAVESALQKLLGDHQGPVHYFSATADLDGDAEPEWIVYLVGPTVCGTGGCNTLVFTEDDGVLRMVTRISVTRTPIVVADTATRGWRDLIVHVAGGGRLPGYDVRLRYDGSAYPTNPTVKPAEPVRGRTAGMVVIPAFQSFAEGAKLR